MYATKILGLSEPVAYSFIAVSRKSLKVPQLKAAIQARQLSVSKASRIISTLRSENAEELISFAQTHTTRQIDFEIARRNPHAAKRDRIKPLSGDLIEITVKVSKATYEKLKRVESLEAQKGNSIELGHVLDVALESHLNKHDPVRKAERVIKRNRDPKLCSNRVPEPRVNKTDRLRKPLTAAQKSEVFARDKGKCTHVHTNGIRCNQDRWIDVHHILSVSLGGTNEPSNLTTLCSFHHDLAHQLSLPIDGQVTWLRSPAVEYAV